MEIYKDPSMLSGFRLEVAPELDYQFSHIGEYLSAREMILYPHHHFTWELLLLTEGSTTWAQGEKQVALREGELLLCPPGLVHFKNRVEARNYRFHFLGCKMDPGVWPDLRAHLPVDRMSTLPHAAELVLNFRIAEEELLFSRPRQREGVELAWKQLWLAIHRLAVGHQRPWNREQKWLAQRVRTLVESNPGDKWTLEVTARFMGYSPTYFASLFKRESGLSFHQYLVTARIDAAKKALELGEETVTEIALRLGFSSSQHFSRVFAEKTGTVPSRWNRRSRKNRPATRAGKNARFTPIESIRPRARAF